MLSAKEQPGSEDCYLPATTAAFIRGVMLLQEKWVLIIVHILLDGSISFNELMRKGNVNTTTLTQRLNLLEEAGVVKKTVHSMMPPRTSYQLTTAGTALKPVLDSVTEWSSNHLQAATGIAPKTD